MNAVSVYDFRNDLANYLNEITESNRPLVISRFGKPLATVYPYDRKKFPVKAETYFGFLGKGETGEKFLSRIRRSAPEKAYVKNLG